MNEVKTDQIVILINNILISSLDRILII